MRYYRSKRIDMSSIDRISALPDDVLVYILSFLATKISVSTSILSRRWRFLWAHVPNLDFETGDYVTVTAMNFHYIIDTVFLRHKGHFLHTFRLDLPHYRCTNSEMERWISAAIARNVRNFDIGYADLECDGLFFPQCLFTCKTVVELSLNRCGYISSTGDVNLPRLKKLNLEMVKYESEESFPHVLSGSPVLEELTVRADNCVDTMVCCCISLPSLNRLVLELECNEFADEAFGVKIDTPALRYLKLHDWESQNVSAGRLTSLYEADICFYYDKEVRDVLDSRNVVEFVGKLYNVKYLTLSTGSMKVSNSVFSGLTTKFHNLTEVNLCADSRFITYFLENADNLRSLTINMQFNRKLKYWVEPKHIPASLISHLETVRFKCFRCTEVGFDMIRYILRNAKVLKMIGVYFHLSFDLEKKTEAFKRISLFERGSEACLFDMH